jgi:hypothetical protein
MGWTEPSLFKATSTRARMVANHHSYTVRLRASLRVTETISSVGLVMHAAYRQAFETNNKSRRIGQASSSTAIGSPNGRAGYPPNSSSSALASFRSAVSKPSVNQP